MKVFGVGLNRTGTTSLGWCMKHLGRRHRSCSFDALKALKAGDTEAVFRMTDQYDSFEDWPWPLMYPLLDARYPDAKFVLTLRKDEDVWFESLCRRSWETGPTEIRALVYGHTMPQDHKDELVAFYRKHNSEVQEYFRDRPGKLLVVCWERGDGWPELCEFLGIPVPDAPFPHKRKKKALDFWILSARMKAFLTTGRWQ